MPVTVSMPDTADVKVIVTAPAKVVVLKVEVVVVNDEKLRKCVEVVVMVVDSVVYVVVADVKTLDEVVVVEGRAPGAVCALIAKTTESKIAIVKEKRNAPNIARECLFININPPNLKASARDCE